MEKSTQLLNSASRQESVITHPDVFPFFTLRASLSFLTDMTIINPSLFQSAWEGLLVITDSTLVIQEESATLFQKAEKV